MLFSHLVATCNAVAASLLLVEVNDAFERIANFTGKGSHAARKQEFGHLFDRATLSERDFLVRLVLGELRQGALG